MACASRSAASPGRMKIGIFCEPHQAALGGSEDRVAVLAEAFAGRTTSRS